MSNKPLKTTRHFGKYPGKLYYFAGEFDTKIEANYDADRHRKRGKLVRITYHKSTGAYQLWTR